MRASPVSQRGGKPALASKHIHLYKKENANLVQTSHSES